MMKRTSKALDFWVCFFLSSAFAAPHHLRDALQCTATTTDGLVFVDATCIDPLYDDATVVSEDDTYTASVSVRVIACRFPKASLDFTVYLPQPSGLENRFIQFVYPSESATPRPDVLGSAIEYGARPAAKFARDLAADFYSRDRSSFYGYIYGGNGGSYQTVCAMENTQGVWQGAVPYILANPTSIPLGQDVIAYATLVLQDKLDTIKDAIRPGGSGDPRADLLPYGRDVYDEVSKLGIQERSWELLNYTWASGGLHAFYPSIKAIDPTYASDFWSVDGYLDTEKSALGDFFRSKRVKGALSITDVQAQGTIIPSVTVALPDNVTSFYGVDFEVSTGNGSLPVSGAFDAATGVFTVTPGSYNASISANATLVYDNAFFLAAHVYHRYQVPSRPGFYPWDQFRNADGSSIYPQ